MAYDIAQTCFLLPIDLNRSECASWVQAWGTILALIVAIGVPATQMWRAQRVSRTAARNRTSAFIGAMHAVQAGCNHAIGKLKLMNFGTGKPDPDFYDYDLVFIRRAETALARFMAHDIADVELHYALTSLEEEIAASLIAAHKFRDCTDHDVPVWKSGFIRAIGDVSTAAELASKLASAHHRAL